MTRTIFTALFAAGALISAAPAFAQDNSVRTEHVSYADLNLSSDSGVRTFKRRLDHAVATVCGDVATADLSDYSEMSNCRIRARAKAKAGFELAMAGQTGAGEIRIASR